MALKKVGKRSKAEITVINTSIFDNNPSPIFLSKEKNL